MGRRRREKEEEDYGDEESVINEGKATIKVKNVQEVEEVTKTSYEDQRFDRNGKAKKTSKEERQRNTKKESTVNNSRKSYEEKVTTNGREISSFRLDQPTLRTTYNISNIDCMGQSEVQLTQKVIDGVAAIIEIEKKIKDGSRIDDFLTIPATPPLPAPPLRKMTSGAALAFLMESI